MPTAYLLSGGGWSSGVARIKIGHSLGMGTALGSHFLGIRLMRITSNLAYLAEEWSKQP